MVFRYAKNKLVQKDHTVKYNSSIPTAYAYYGGGYTAPDYLITLFNILKQSEYPKS